MNFANFKVSKIKVAPNIFKYFSIFYPFSLIFSRYEVFFIYSRSISSILSMALTLIIFLNYNFLKNKDKVANKYIFFWIYFILLVQAINFLNSSISLINLDLPFILSTFFLISFVFILSRYPILINYSLFSLIFSGSILSFIQFLGIGVNKILFTGTITANSYAREIVFGFHPNELSIYYSSCLLLISFYFFNKYKFEKQISKNKLIINIINISFLLFIPFILYGLYASGSRTGLAILIFGLFSLIFISYYFVKSKRQFIKQFLICLLLLIVIFFLIQSFGGTLSFKEMFRFDQSETFLIRRQLITYITSNIASKNLFLGYGSEGLTADTREFFGYEITTHNGFIDVFSYSGLIGLISFLVFLISLLIKVSKIAFFEKDFLFPLIYFIVLAELALSTLFQSKLLFFFTAILIAGVSSRRKSLIKKTFYNKNE